MSAKPLVHGAGVHRRARKYKEEFLRKFFGKPRQSVLRRGKRWPSIGAWDTKGSNICGIGFGTKHVNGQGVEGSALLIYVKRKKAKKNLRRADRIPETINGLPTDVIEVGRFVAAVPPVDGGCGGANAAAPAGTLGCLVEGVSGSANRYILSCLHVLAANMFAPATGESILEPAGGREIAKLWSWINMGAAGNHLDCAIARLDDPASFDPILAGLGRQNPTPLAAVQNSLVKKSGSMAPNVTQGTIVDVSNDPTVGYPGGVYVGFVQQIAVSGANGQPFAQQGDSGSLVVDAATLQPIGLLFSVDDQQGIALVNPIIPLLNQLGIGLV